MKRILTTAAAFGLAVGLAGCGEKQAGAPPPAAEPAAASQAGEAPQAGEAIVAKATGTVVAADPAAGTITLEHGAIPEVNWPAMTMSFKAAPELARSVKAGDKVAVDLRVQSGAGEITALQKQ